MLLAGEYLSASEAKPKPPFAQRQVTLSFQDYIQLEADKNYWHAQFQHAQAKLTELTSRIADLEAQVADLTHRLYGKHSEKGQTPSEAQLPPREKKQRGHQAGTPRVPRVAKADLPVIEEHSVIPEAERVCPCCGLPYHEINNTEDAEVLEIEVKAHKRVIHRHKYVKTCHCEGGKAVLTAPPPLRLFNRNLYGISIWTEVLLEKFQYGRSLHSVCKDFAQRGLSLAAGTLTNGFKRMPGLFAPVIQQFETKQLSETLFYNDETYWKEYERTDSKRNTQWYLWLFRSQSVTLFIAADNRSGDTPIGYYQKLTALGYVIVVCDRYSAYKRLARQNPRIILAFCWAHVRRDFLDDARSYPELRDWMQQWVDQIANLYHSNHQRLSHWNSELPLVAQSVAFNRQQAVLEQAIAQLKTDYTQALLELDPKTQKIQIAVLTSLQTHWAGLTVFVTNPAVPMDNNLSERTLRGAILGRNNYFGSGAIWSAELAAQLFSLFATLQQWGINRQRWLYEYLTVCAQNHGKPPDDLTDFIPWLMSDERRAALSRLLE
jgi:transposase